MLEAERIAKDPSVMGYSDMDELFADLRHYRIIQRVRIGAKICAAKRRKTAGILCVLQGFATHFGGQIGRQDVLGELSGDALGLSALKRFVTADLRGATVPTLPRAAPKPSGR